MNRRGARPRGVVPLRLARLLAMFAVLLQCLSPVLAQSMPLTPASMSTGSMPAHRAHCPHHPPHTLTATAVSGAPHPLAPCCGTGHCACVAPAATEMTMERLRLPGVDHPSATEQSPSTVAAFDRERLRPPNPPRNA